MKRSPKLEVVHVTASTLGNYRPATKKPCSDCPFRRKAAPGWLGAGTPQSFIIEISYERPLPCHQTIDYEDQKWLDKWTAQQTGNICAGALIVSANMGKLPRDRRFPRMPADKKLCFSNHTEFIEFHENAPVRSWELDDEPRLKKEPIVAQSKSKPKRKKPLLTDSHETARDLYVERIKDAMVTSSDEMPRVAYIDALEEIRSDIDSMLEAARDEQNNDDEA